MDCPDNGRSDDGELGDGLCVGGRWIKVVNLAR